MAISVRACSASRKPRRGRRGDEGRTKGGRDRYLQGRTEGGRREDKGDDNRDIALKAAEQLVYTRAGSVAIAVTIRGMTVLAVLFSTHWLTALSKVGAIAWLFSTEGLSLQNYCFFGYDIAFIPPGRQAMCSFRAVRAPALTADVLDAVRAAPLPEWEPPPH